MDSMEFLDIITPSEDKENFKLGTIKSGKVQFDNEETPSRKQYKILNNIILVENDRVLLASVSGTYIILGKI